MMQKWIPILGGLLAAQLVLAVVVNLSGEDYAAFQPEEKLLAFERDAVDEVRIETGENKLVLSKQEGRWRLPDSENFPANQEAVKRLLDSLAGLEKGWPVATTAGAARRFKVSDEEFERRLTLAAKDKPVAQLYLGTSPGFRKQHVRAADQDEVFAVEFNSWEANASADDWIDKGILKLDAGGLSRIETPAFTLQRDDQGWRVADLAETEAANAAAIQSLVDKLAGLRIEAVLGTEAKPDYRQDQPVIALKLTQNNGEHLSYVFSKPEQGDYYVLHRSGLDYFLKLGEYMVKPILEAKRGQLVKAKSGEEADKADSPADGAASEDAAG